MSIKKLTKNYSALSLIILIITIFGSCSSSKDELSKKINIALRNDNVIDKSEWDEFVLFTSVNNEELPQLIGENNKVSTEELTNLILIIARKRRDQEPPEIHNPQKKNEIIENPDIKVFIENSGSMDGYVRNTTEFEAALSDLLVQIKYYYDSEKLNVNFINTKIYESEIDEVNHFVETLEPSKAPYKVGNRSVSKLNEILEIILDSTSQKNVSILISDCIYSLEKNKDTQGALEFQKSLTKGAFLEKSKEFNFSTIVLKMNSKFNGLYYDKNDKPTQLSDKSRPYYIWIIGSDKHIESFSKNIDLKSLKGFDNSYLLSNAVQDRSPYFTVLKETNKIGAFKQADRTAKDVTSINSLEYENGLLQFSIAINLKNIPVDQAYLINPENYIVPSGYTIKSIEKVNREKITRRDFVTVEKTIASHVITIATSNKFSVQDLELELSNKIPFWVETSSSLDDTNINNQLDKTFGLLYLVEGVSEAYKLQNPDNKSYFKINVTIKK